MWLMVITIVVYNLWLPYPYSISIYTYKNHLWLNNVHWYDEISGTVISSDKLGCVFGEWCRCRLSHCILWYETFSQHSYFNIYSNSYSHIGFPNLTMSHRMRAQWPYSRKYLFFLIMRCQYSTRWNLITPAYVTTDRTFAMPYILMGFIRLVSQGCRLELKTNIHTAGFEESLIVFSIIIIDYWKIHIIDYHFELRSINSISDSLRSRKLKHKICLKKR